MATVFELNPAGTSHFKVDDSGNATIPGKLTLTGALTAAGAITAGGDINAASGDVNMQAGSLTSFAPFFRAFANIGITEQGNGATTLYTVPAGKTLYVERAWVSVETLFDGTAPVLDLGDTGDPNGYLAAVDITSTGFTGLNNTENAAALFDGTNDASILRKVDAADVISYTLGGSSSTAGAFDLFVRGFLVTS